MDRLSPAPADASRWPDAHLTAMLQAAVGAGDRAIAGWRQVNDARTQPNWTQAEARLLPLAWWRLRQEPEVLGVDPLQAVYRTTWAANHETLAAAASILAAFAAAGIETMVFRGAGLMTATYSRVGLRAIGDVDLLVRPADAARARRLMSDLGFEPKVVYQGNAISCVHSLNFERPRLSVDLHWRALKECQGTEDDGDLWTHSRPLDIAGSPTRVPAPEDHLILVCAHGLRWTAEPSVHWLADAATLVNATGDQAINWDRLISVTRSRHLVLSMRRALDFLATQLGAAVPARVLDALATTSVSRREQWEHTVLMRPPTLMRGLVRQWCEHSRLHPGQSGLRRAAGFPEWLRSAWGISDAAGVPRAALRKIASRFS